MITLSGFPLYLYGKEEMSFLSFPVFFASTLTNDKMELDAMLSTQGVKITLRNIPPDKNVFGNFFFLLFLQALDEK